MKDELLFCPLGGSGEIGMNLNLYAYGKEDNEKWIVVDMGVTFADDSIPGIDLIYPDPGFLIDKKKQILEGPKGVKRQLDSRLLILMDIAYDGNENPEAFWDCYDQ